MRYQYDGYTLIAIELLKQLHNLLAGLRIQIAGWFIGENERGVID